jgi:hypothetical protein
MDPNTSKHHLFKTNYVSKESRGYDLLACRDYVEVHKVRLCYYFQLQVFDFQADFDWLKRRTKNA